MKMALSKIAQGLQKGLWSGAKAFEQAAGFLRIRGGDNPLDASAIHPESYPIAEALLEESRHLTSQIPPAARQTGLDALKVQAARRVNWRLSWARASRPWRISSSSWCALGAIRARMRPPPILRSDVLSMDDLAGGMRLKGTVRNVVDFGAFVDIGVKQDGLAAPQPDSRGHRFCRQGDVIDVEILKVEAERGRISLRWAGE